MRTVSDYTELSSLSPAQNPEITEYINERSLEMFVDSDWNIWYKAYEHQYNPSFRRALQDVRRLVKFHSPAEIMLPKITGVASAAWNSFQSHLTEEIEQLQIKQGHVDARPTDKETNEQIDELLDEMVDRNASDLHIKTLLDDAKTIVRMRINGLLQQTHHWDYATGDAILRSLFNHYCAGANRIDGDINNGSFYYAHSNTRREYMIRLNESPEKRGTICVARIRDPKDIWPLHKIGYNRQQEETLNRILTYRSGMVSINGPTNSGKSSTQSSILAMLPREMHIVEIGDPIECLQDHVAHIELSDSYPKGKDAHLEEVLKSTVRQDPDVLALTEMRDKITSKAALQLASQGKFVLTTMHTSSFISSFERLHRLGMTPEDIVAPGFLRGLIAQKLLPRLCPDCCLPKSPEPNVTQRLAYLLGDTKKTIRYRNKSGCGKCSNTGVISRILVAEAVEITDEVLAIVREIIFESNPAKWYDYARRHDIYNTHQHARQHCLDGLVDPAIAESELGAFTEKNLLWLHPATGKSGVVNLHSLTP